MADYKIQPGDTLSALAAKNNTSVSALQAANPSITDPNKIYAGANLVIPTASPTTPSSPLTDIESQIAGIRASAAALADQQNQPVLAQQIRNPNVITPPNPNNTGTIIDMSQSPKPPLASAAVAKISSLTNNLPAVPTNEQDYSSILSDLKNQLTAAENPTFSEEAKMQQEYTDMGVYQNIDLIKSITSQSLSIKAQMDKLDQQEADAISNSYNDSGMTIEIANNARTGIQNDYARQKAPLAASLASLQTQSALASNNLDLAKSYADSLVSAAVYDAEAKATAIANVGNLYADVLKSMSQDDQNAYAAAQKQADATLAQQTTERKQVVSWATTPATAPALVGVDLSTISFDDAADKVRDYVAQKTPAPSPTPTPTTLKFTATQSAKGSSTAGLPIADFQSLDYDTRNIFINDSGSVDDDKTFITEQLAAGTSKDTLKAGIDNMDRTDAYKQWLKNYVDKQPAPKAATATPAKPWWQFW